MLHHLSQQSDQDKQKKTGTGVSIGRIAQIAVRLHWMNVTEL